MPARRTPPWLWPNLLSLDAPFVAMVWLAMFSRVWLGYLEWHNYLALGLGVWAIYTADRLLDVKVLHASDPRLGPRHEFVRRHQKLLAWLVAVAVAGCVFLAFFVLPSRLIGHGLFPGGEPAEYGYLFPAALMTLGFFSMTLSSAGTTEIPHLRNLLAGLAFSYGTAMTAHLNIGTEGIFHLLFSREMLSFAALCTVNISAIHFWEQSRQSADPDFKAAHELAVTLPLALLAGACLLFAVLDQETTRRPLYYAVMMSAALLFVLNHRRERFSIDALRVLADLALVAPFPVFWLLSSNR
jgi:hypothetical protein